MNRYTWVWEGQTQKGTCTWETVDGQLVNGTEFTGTVEQDIIDRTKATYYSTIVGEFVKLCREQGLSVNLLSVDVECQIVKDNVVSSCYFISRGEHYKCVYTLPFYIKVKGTVLFESEADLAGSPIVPALVIAIAKAIAIVVAAVIISWGVYEFLKNLTLNETSSTITVEKYDEQGHLIERKTETVKKQEPSWEAWMGVIIVVIVIFAFLMVIPHYLPKR